MAIQVGDKIPSVTLKHMVGLLKPDQGRVDWGETVHLGYYDQQSSALIDG